MIIASVVNNKDGATVTATCQGVPQGDVTFLAARVPHRDQAIAVPSTPATNSGDYTVTLPAPTLWYIWVQDDLGVDAHNPPGAVWVGITGIQDVDEVGQLLADVLEENRAGLEAALRTWYPKATLKQIAYGFPAQILEFPSILVLNPVWSDADFASNFTMIRTYQFTIAFNIVHDDEETQTPNVVRFANAAMRILNQPYYRNRLVTPDGIELFDGYAQKGESTEVDLGDSFAAAATLVWSASGLRQDAGNTPQ